MKPGPSLPRAWGLRRKVVVILMDNLRYSTWGDNIRCAWLVMAMPWPVDAPWPKAKKGRP